MTPEQKLREENFQLRKTIEELLYYLPKTKWKYDQWGAVEEPIDPNSAISKVITEAEELLK